MSMTVNPRMKCKSLFEVAKRTNEVLNRASVDFGKAAKPPNTQTHFPEMRVNPDLQRKQI